jgi:hypothetical protein
MIASIFNLRAPHTRNFRLLSNETAGAMRVSSAMCRAAPSSRRRIVSFAGAICSRLMPSRLCKVTFFTDKEYFWIAHYIGHERIFFPKICFPLRRRKYFWIDFPRQLRGRPDCMPHSRHPRPAAAWPTQQLVAPCRVDPERSKCDAFSLDVLQEAWIGMRLRMLPFILPNRQRLDVDLDHGDEPRESFY